MELSERVYEARIRELITDQIVSADQRLGMMESKKAVDILLYRNGAEPQLFFVEVKFHKEKHGRLGFGSASGIGFQPEILTKNPDYFESNMRWIIGSEAHGLGKFIFLTNEQMRLYVAGGEVGKKFNNIQKRILKDAVWLSERDLITALKDWLFV